MERLTKREMKNVNGQMVMCNYTLSDCNDFCEYVFPCKWFDKVTEKLKAYEDAEEQGLLQRIECHCKNCIHWSDKVAGATEHVKLCTVGGYMVGKNGYCVYAEQALEEMKGE